MRRRISLSYLKLQVVSLLCAPLSAFACPDIDGLVDINCDQQMVIVPFGDSITYGVGDSRKLGYPGRLRLLLPHSNVRNLGIPGETTSRGRKRAPGVFKRYKNKADYIVIMEGVNDYWMPRRSSLNTRSNLLSIRRYADSTGGVSAISKLTAVKRNFQSPWVAAVNRRISSIASVNFNSLGRGVIGYDNLHPNGSGYKRMASYLQAKLNSIANRNRPADKDQDGIYDFAESRFGTNRSLYDTDSDGLLDGAEIFNLGTDPLSSDSDQDGLPDGSEVLNYGSSPINPLPAPPTIDSLEALL